MKPRELAEQLEAGGCYFVRSANGSHRMYYSPITKRKFTVPWHKDIDEDFAKIILKQAGLK